MHFTPNDSIALRLDSISCASPNPFRTMFAPALARVCAIPRPMPLVEPVMIALLLVKSVIVLF